MMMHIYPADLLLQEHTFFASREIDPLYASEPLIGNYALTYALGFCHAPYRWDGGPRYKEDFTPLNEQGLYITPAQFSLLRMTLTRFNGQIDSYYARFAQNAITMQRDPNEKVRATNFPQSGRIRMLGLGSRARFFLLDRDHLIVQGKGPRLLPYIRLGKFMSKARIKWQEKITPQLLQKSDVKVSGMLNAADLEDTTSLLVFSSYNIHPAPILHDVHMSGQFWQLGSDSFLPTNMHYGVETL
jgi:CRISPR-associated protein Csc1